MDDFNLYEEKEVLLEPVCNFEVLEAEKFDAGHRMVQMGEIKAGLHRVVGRVRPGVELLSGSPVKEGEKVSYRYWREEQQKKENNAQMGALNLTFCPFTQEEWVNMGKTVPQRDKEKRMSLLGKGAFMSTYRKTTRGASAGQEVCRYAVKVMDRDDMLDMGLTEEDVRREARTLGQLRHRHIVRYCGLEVTDEVVGIVMELAEGGSLAGFIKECALKGCVDSREVLVMTTQIADAMDYMHSQGVVHRDIKADNILLAHAGEGAIHIKVADFGVAVVLDTVGFSWSSEQIARYTPILCAGAWEEPKVWQDGRHVGSRMRHH